VLQEVNDNNNYIFRRMSITKTQRVNCKLQLCHYNKIAQNHKHQLLKQKQLTEFYVINSTMQKT